MPIKATINADVGQRLNDLLSNDAVRQTLVKEVLDRAAHDTLDRWSLGKRVQLSGEDVQRLKQQWAEHYFEMKPKYSVMDLEQSWINYVLDPVEAYFAADLIAAE